MAKVSFWLSIIKVWISQIRKKLLKNNDSNYEDIKKQQNIHIYKKIIRVKALLFCLTEKVGFEVYRYTSILICHFY